VLENYGSPSITTVDFQSKTEMLFIATVWLIDMIKQSYCFLLKKFILCFFKLE